MTQGRSPEQDVPRPIMGMLRFAEAMPAVTGRLVRALVYAFSVIAAGIWALVTVVNLSITDRGQPAAGAWPLLLALALVVLSLLGLWREWRSAPAEDDLPLSLPQGRHLWQSGVFVLTLALYYALLPVLGFLVASVIMIFVCQIVLMSTGFFWRKLIMAIVVGFAIHSLFAVVLSFKVPMGIFGAL